MSEALDLSKLEPELMKSITNNVVALEFLKEVARFNKAKEPTAEQTDSLVEKSAELISKLLKGINKYPTSHRENYGEWFYNNAATRLLPHYRTAPASTRYHGSFPGGLCVHTAAVMALCCSYHVSDLWHHNAPLSYILVAAFLHDIGKLGFLEFAEKHDLMYVYSHYYYNPKEGEDGYKRNPKVPDHVETGQYNLLKLVLAVGEDSFIPIPVWEAITYHNGAYTETLKWPMKGNESGLLLFLHFCDCLASRSYI